MLEYVVGETEMRIWVVGIDAAGARCCISSYGTWKARTRSRHMRRQDYWGTDGLVRVVDRNDRSRTRRTMRACWFPAVEQELFDAVAAAEITKKLGLHKSRHRQWFSRSACANADDGFLESLDQISRTLASWN